MPIDVSDVAGEPEGARVAAELPPVIDAHVHVFPDAIFRALWRWFDEYGWPVRYQLYADDVIAHLKSRGVRDVVLLHYAHKPGIARSMNAFVAALVRRHGVTGMATVAPDDDDVAAILDEAFAAGLRGVKLHTHVQGVAADDRRLFAVYELCQERALPVVIHAGREPKSDALPVDPYTICDARRLEAVLRAFPRLRVCVPHLGADEFADYARLVRTYDTLWLDTTMMLGDFFDVPGAVDVVKARPDRVLYGSDFPNVPYAWDRELKCIARLGLPDRALELLLAENARQLFGLS